MKQNIHPDFHPVCFVDVSSGARFLTRSTMKSKQVENIDGVDYYMISRDVTADSHPHIQAKNVLSTLPAA